MSDWKGEAGFHGSVVQRTCDCVTEPVEKGHVMWSFTVALEEGERHFILSNSTPSRSASSHEFFFETNFKKSKFK